jgi:acyl dehydratase
MEKYMSNKEVKFTDSQISDEMIEEMRGKIGLKLRIDHSIANEDATRMAILKFVDGIGDPNPLFRDIEYAKTSPYKTLIAPPAWVFSVFAGVQFGWRGLGGFHNATDIEFYKPVKLNDIVYPECTYTGFEGPKASAFAESMIVDWYENKYVNQKNELIAKADWSVIRVDRAKARKTGKYHKIELPHPWTDKEAEQVEAEVLSEETRGSTPRYWEDVKIGDELKPVIKGPLGITDEIAFLVGGGAPIPRLMAHGVALRQYQKHPAWSFRDPTTHALEPVFAVHYNQEAAKAMGLPLQYDVGFQRHCWQTHLLTNWMGDSGWLKRSYSEYRRFVYHSDVVWVRGKVTEKFIDDDNECCVKVETLGINQRDEEVMPGYAIIALPSKQKNTSPVDKRI